MFTVLLKVIFIFCVFLPLQDVLFTSKLTMHGIHLVKEEDYIWYNDSFFFDFFSFCFLKVWLRSQNCWCVTGRNNIIVVLRFAVFSKLFFYFQWIDSISHSPPPPLIPPLPLSRSLWTQPWPILLNILILMMFSDVIVLFVAPMLEASLIITSTLQKRKKRKRLSASSGKLESNIFIKAIGFVNHMRRHFKTWFMNSMYACIF